MLTKLYKTFIIERKQKEHSDSDSDTSSSVADSDDSIPLWEDQTEDIINCVLSLNEESIMEVF